MRRTFAAAAALLASALAACGGSSATACARAAGTVAERSCCASASDFPNTCAVGACGCAPDASVQVKVCECPAGRCFDGDACVTP